MAEMLVFKKMLKEFAIGVDRSSGQTNLIDSAKKCGLYRFDLPLILVNYLSQLKEGQRGAGHKLSGLMLQ